MRKPKGKARKLVVPIVLTVSAVTTALTVATTVATTVVSAGCDDDDPHPVDAGPPDTPIV